MTAQSEVADGRGRPHIVHRPDHRFTAVDNLSDILERQHTLVDPMQMNDIRLLELWQGSDVETDVGDVYAKEVLAREMEMPEDAPSFPQEIPLGTQGTLHSHYGDIIAHLVTHQHLSLNAIIVKGIHQTVGSHSSSTRPLACIYYEYSHDNNLYLLQR